MKNTRLVQALYVTSVLVANLTATIFIDFGITFALGTLVFGFIFTLRDVLHRSAGKNTTIQTILIATIVNAVCLMALNAVGLNFFDFSWRILAASTIALLLSELADTQIYQQFIAKSFTFRVFSSNAISIPLDTILFSLIAFLGVLNAELLISIIIGDTVVKFLIASLVWVFVVRKNTL